MTGSQISAVIFAVSLALFFFVAAYIIASQITATKRQISERVIKILPEEKSLLKEFRESDPDKAAKKKKSLFKNKKLLDIIQNELLLANIMMRPEEFCLIWLLAASVPSGLIALFMKSMMSSITAAVLGVFFPIIIVRSRKKKRTAAFENQLSDALIIVCNCLRSGLSFQQAMETISKEMTEPISVEFGRVVSEIQYGNSLEKALNNLVARIKSADLLLTVSAVNIQKQTGGNLSEILETISETIKERMKIKGDIKSMTAQGRISGMIIGLLPVAMGAFLMLINPAYMSLLFTDKIGNICILMAIVMESIGFVLIKKIITVKF